MRLTAIGFAFALVVGGSWAPSTLTASEASLAVRKSTQERAAHASIDREIAKAPDVPPPTPAPPGEGGGIDSFIVGLVVPDLVEPSDGAPFDAPARAARTAAVAAAQDAFVARATYEGLEVRHRYKYIPFLEVSADAAALAALRADPGVASVHENRPQPLALYDSTRLIGATRVWPAGATGNGQFVVVLDSGVDATHPFLNGRVPFEICTSSTIPSQAIRSACPNGQDFQVGAGAAAPCAAPGCDHGTHVAGIVAGRGTIFSGVAPNAAIVAVQVSSIVDNATICQAGKESPPCIRAMPADQLVGLEAALDLAVKLPVASVNMSLGGGHYETTDDCDQAKPAFKEIFDLLRVKNVASVVASGNAFDKTGIGAPSCVSSAISVGATNKQDAVADFSNSAPILQLLAPGASIQSSVPGRKYAMFDGTSMAAPHVAGAWAVLRSVKPDATVSEILAVLRATGKPIRDTNGVTVPRIQLDAALLALVGVPTPTPAGPRPTATRPRASATPQASATPSTSVRGLHGKVTLNGRAVRGMKVELLRSSNTLIDEFYRYEITDAAGNYSFTGIPTLGAGRHYRVYFDNSIYDPLTDRFIPQHPDALDHWVAKEVTTFTRGDTVPGGDFDITDIDLQAPPRDVSAQFPVTFHWQPRVPGERYFINLWPQDSSAGPAWRSQEVLSVGQLAVRDKPLELKYGIPYYWDVGVITSTGSGRALGTMRITFEPGAAPAPSPGAPPTPAPRPTATPPAMTSLTVRAAATDVPVGGTVPVEVRVDAVSGLTHFDVELRFDPDRLAVDGAAVPGAALSGLNARELINRVDNQAGTLRYAVALLGQSAGLTGGGVLFTVTVRGVSPGNTVVALGQDTALLDGSGAFITYRGTDARLSVVQAMPSIRGRVRLEGRASHIGTSITAGSRSATTDAAGAFAIGGTTAPIAVVARTGGYLSAQHAPVSVVGTDVLLPDITLPGGDADGDDRVDDADMDLVAASLGATVPPGDARADINGDAVVDLRDVALVSRNHGLVGPVVWGAPPLAARAGAAGATATAAASTSRSIELSPHPRLGALVRTRLRRSGDRARLDPAAGVEADDEAVLSVEPSDATLSVGGTATFDVRIAGAADLVSFDVELWFDPAVVSVPGPLADGTVFGARPFRVLRSEVDNATGMLRYAATLVAGGTGVAGDGVLFRFTVRGLADGGSDLLFGAGCAALDSQANLLEVRPRPGHIAVGAGPAPEPTAMPTPTLVPGRGGVFGQVTAGGVPAAGIEVVLLRYDGESIEPLLSQITGADGRYDFTAAPSTGDGSILVAAYANDQDDPRYLGALIGIPLGRSAAGRTVHGGDLEIGDVVLGPPESATQARGLPVPFRWTPRAAHGDGYLLRLFGEPVPGQRDEPPTWTADTPVGNGEHVLAALPAGFAYHQPYRWTVMVARAGTLGIARDTHDVVFGDVIAPERFTLYLPALRREPPAAPPKGIFGTVTRDGAAIGGIRLELRKMDGDGATVQTIATTGADGRYSFIAQSALAADEAYVVAFRSSPSDAGCGGACLGAWDAERLAAYRSGETVHGGDFDIGDVTLVSPARGARLDLPGRFCWTPRLVDGDHYQLSLRNRTRNEVIASDIRARADCVSMAALPPGWLPGDAYEWWVGVYRSAEPHLRPFHAGRSSETRALAPAAAGRPSSRGGGRAGYMERPR